jgi:hypothetical protein
VIDALAFLVALPVAVELIAAAYGPLDCAGEPRRAAWAALRLLGLLALAAALAWWLRAPFVLGLAAYAALFLAKHLANAWLTSRRADYQYPVWSDERTGDAAPERRDD